MERIIKRDSDSQICVTTLYYGNYYTFSKGFKKDKIRIGYWQHSQTW